MHNRERPNYTRVLDTCKNYVFSMHALIITSENKTKHTNTLKPIPGCLSARHSHINTKAANVPWDVHRQEMFTCVTVSLIDTYECVRLCKLRQVAKNFEHWWRADPWLPSSYTFFHAMFPEKVWQDATLLCSTLEPSTQHLSSLDLSLSELSCFGLFPSDRKLVDILKI